MLPIPEVVVVPAVAVRIRTAADMAQVSVSLVYNWIKSGKLKTVGVGADQRIIVQEFAQFLREGRGSTRKKARR